MKSLKSLLAVLTALCLLTGCGSSADDGNGGEERSEHKSSETESSNDKDDDSESDEDSTDSEETKSKSCRKMIGTKKYPEVTAVIFTAESIGSLKDNSSVSESSNVIHQGVVGRVGAPIELVFNKWVTPQKLTFCYDKDELRGIPEKNLIVLHYNEDDAFYDTVEGSVLDTDACTIECEVSEEGAYLLAEEVSADLAIHIICLSLFKRLKSVNVIIYYYNYRADTIGCNGIAYNKSAAHSLRSILLHYGQLQHVIATYNSLLYRYICTEIKVSTRNVINQVIGTAYLKLAVFFASCLAYTFQVFNF